MPFDLFITCLIIRVVSHKPLMTHLTSLIKQVINESTHLLSHMIQDGTPKDTIWIMES